MENEKKDWRLSVTLTKQQEDAILSIRQKDEFRRCSLGEIVRKLIDAGLSAGGYQKE